ncbi:restriction endonuclease subunit S [Gordonia sp. FQ]|uniref:restriction endonuclease subunit S n=1 Tax=Gordonia sp. FQ TaxID=3446634 RepID=UPI003F869BC0
MNTLIKTRDELIDAGRWDIDFHLPPEGVLAFPPEMLYRVDEVASISKGKRDPTKSPDDSFRYIDISSVEVVTGAVTGAQVVVGHEAPSRARKVLRALDILVSTVRPTRGAVALVPKALHNEIGSTGFSVVRANDDVNPFYLQFALRLDSTREQFRKWSSGSSYPAILDEDVAKTLIPLPEPREQDRIAKRLMAAATERALALARLDEAWSRELRAVVGGISGSPAQSVVEGVHDGIDELDLNVWLEDPSSSGVRKFLDELPALSFDAPTRRGRKERTDA